jgi:manganese transport protein
VMPHNLYLHSSLVQSRKIGPTPENKRQAIRYNTFDSVLALNMAFFVNAAILVAAAATFYRTGHYEVAEIQDAHRLLAPILGTAIAPVAFAVALLAAGQSSTITGTLAGQIVMEGYLNIRLPPWIRRLITRLLAIIPAVIAIVYFGEGQTGTLLILSQVVLSLQLPFAIIPMIHFVSDRKKMGQFATGKVIRVLAWVTTTIIVVLNVKLVIATLHGWLGPGSPAWIGLVLWPLIAFLATVLLYVTLKPWLPRVLTRRRRAEPADVHEPDLARAGGLPLEIERKPLRRVAVAIDFSGRFRRAIREMLRIVGSERPQIALMHVVESATARFLGPDADDIETQKDSQRLEEYAKELRTLGFEVTTRIGTGKPVPELARMVKEFDADLVVLSAHGHRFLSDLLRGSTVDRLRHEIDATVVVVGKKD